MAGPMEMCTTMSFIREPSKLRCRTCRWADTNLSYGGGALGICRQYPPDQPPNFGVTGRRVVILDDWGCSRHDSLATREDV